MIELVLYGGRQCSLCDRLDRLMGPHLEKLRGQAVVKLVKRDIGDDPEWRRRYGVRIPVLVHDGRVVLEGRPEADEVAEVFAGLLSRHGG